MNPIQKVKNVLKKFSSSPTASIYPVTRLGETYAGIIVENGAPSYHLILSPDEILGCTWTDAVDWVEPKDGDLPTIQESRLLYCNLPGATPDKFWTAEAHAAYANCAWLADGRTGAISFGQADRQSGSAILVRRVKI